MGDRVLIQFKNDREVSPVIYGHNAGHATAQLIADLRKQMADRPDDMSYIAARCVGRLTAIDSNGSTGVGMWNATEAVTKEATHGDAGVWLITLGKRWHVKQLCGYRTELVPAADIDWELVS